MSALDLENETELALEIDDLASYLRGVPADLCESAFTPYEVRLQQLLETLCRYESAVANHPISSEHRATLEEIQRWVRIAERRHEEAARIICG